jgi:hypothetical protein
MRAIVAVSITAFVLVARRNHSTSADAGANVAKSIDPTLMTSNAPDMPRCVGPLASLRSSNHKLKLASDALSEFAV